MLFACKSSLIKIYLKKVLLLIVLEYQIEILMIDICLDKFDDARVRQRMQKNSFSSWNLLRLLYFFNLTYKENVIAFNALMVFVAVWSTR